MFLFKKKPIPVLNLDITPTGWEGPFEAYGAPSEREKEPNKKYVWDLIEGGWLTKDFVGERHLDEFGFIHEGVNPNLHTLQGTTNIIEAIYAPTIVFDEEVFQVISNKKDKPCLCKVLPGRTPLVKIPHPIYTLEGLYLNLPNQEIYTRLGGLMRVLTLFGENVTIDPAIKDETNKLRVLESRYDHFLKHLSLEDFVDYAG